MLYTEVYLYDRISMPYWLSNPGLNCWKTMAIEQRGEALTVAKTGEMKRRSRQRICEYPGYPRRFCRMDIIDESYHLKPDVAWRLGGMTQYRTKLAELTQIHVALLNVAGQYPRVAYNNSRGRHLRWFCALPSKNQPRSFKYPNRVTLLNLL